MTKSDTDLASASIFLLYQTEDGAGASKLDPEATFRKFRIVRNEGNHSVSPTAPSTTSLSQCGVLSKMETTRTIQQCLQVRTDGNRSVSCKMAAQLFAHLNRNLLPSRNHGDPR